MKTLLLTVFLSLSIMNNVLSSSCKTILKDVEFHSSDYVFLGMVMEIDNTHFDVKVNEIFKGDMDEIFRVRIDDDSVLPKQGEIWLFYSKKQKGNNYVSKCGWSRSFNWPFSANSKTFPEPPPNASSDDLLKFLDKFNFEIALSELRYDIISLRQIKIQKELSQIMSETNAKTNEDNKRISDHLKFFKWSLLISIGLILILGIKIFSK